VFVTIEPTALTVPRSEPRRGAARRHAHAIGIAFGAGLLAVEIALGRHELSLAAAAVRSADLRWVAAGLACTLVSMHFFAHAQRHMLLGVVPSASVVQLSGTRMVHLTYSANALCATVPGGGVVAVIYMLRRLRGWGVSYPAAAFALVATGLISTMTFVGFLAASGLATGRADAAIVVACAAPLVLAFGYGARRFFGVRLPTLIAASVRRLGVLVGRVSVTAADALTTAGAEIDGIRPGRRAWAGATGFTACTWLANLASLVAACHAVPGAGQAGVAALMTTYLTGMTASSIAFLPGGFGVVEVAMISVLHAGGVPIAPATAAVLLYRLCTGVVVVALGWFAMAIGSATSQPAG
jgi:hypothetical protein